MRRRVAFQRAAAHFALAMAFTYQYGLNPQIDYPRMLGADAIEFIPGTTTPAYTFQDSEIVAMGNIVSGVWMSSQFWTPPSGQPTLPTSPVNYLRIAALMLDAKAANASQLSSIIQMLDVKLSPDKAAKALREQAEQYRKVDDESGAFVIIEQVTTDWSFRDRFWSQWQRTASM